MVISSVMPVTMQDIADDLNLSVVTVSKVLRNTGKFTAETRERVLRRAKELDYRANWVARSLVTRKTFTVGLLLPELTHSFFAEIAKAIAESLRPQGYHVIISYFEENPELERSETHALIDRQVDGLAIASAMASADPDIMERLRKHKVPVVMIDRLIAGAEVSFVGVDNLKMGRIAVEHLISQGCTRIACLRGPKMQIAEDRASGYRRGLNAHGMESPKNGVVMAGYSDQGGYEGMKTLLGGRPRPDGVVCFSDPVAIGAMRAIVEAGLKVPADIALIGAGNTHYSDLLAVPLTTLDQATAETGRRAAELLLTQMKSKRKMPAEKILIPPRLVVRQSSHLRLRNSSSKR